MYIKLSFDILVFLWLSRSNRLGVFCRKWCSSKFTGKHQCRSLFLNKVVALRPAPVFPCEFCEIFKNAYFGKHLQTTTSDRLMFVLIQFSWRWEFHVSVVSPFYVSQVYFIVFSMGKLVKYDKNTNLNRYILLNPKIQNKQQDKTLSYLSGNNDNFLSWSKYSKISTSKFYLVVYSEFRDSIKCHYSV